MRTLAQWLDYIEHAHTQEIDMGLSRTRQVFSRLCTLTKADLSSACVISVAGTNGKGTTCRFIEQACIQAGKTVAVYASPHIEVFNERIRINGIDATDAQLCDAFSLVYQAAQSPQKDKLGSLEKSDVQQSISLSYFEYATLCALVIFAQAKIDVCILEVGLGGRLDATNIIDANIGVITSIGLDHQAYLGNTKELIAKEKAGIIKSGQALVVGYKDRQQSLNNIIAEQKTATLFAGEHFDLKQNTGMGWLKLANKYYEFDISNANIPVQNVMTAIATLHCIANYYASSKCEHFEALLLEPLEIQKLITRVKLPGRFERIEYKLLQQNQDLIVDVAHNEDAAKYLVNKLNAVVLAKRKQQKNKQKHNINCHIIIGMLKDKNIEATIACLADKLQANHSVWYAVDLPTSRGEKAKRIADAIKTHDATVTCYNDIEAGLKQAIDKAQTDDIILVLGSFVLASQLMQVVNNT